MKIRIIQCSDSRYWYRPLIGQELIFYKEDAKRYWCKEPNSWGALNFVLKEDAERLEEYGENK